MARKAAPENSSKNRSSKAHSVAIAGNGIAAEAMALALARNGREVQLIGDNRAGMPGGVQLAPNGWAALDHLGVKAAATRKATPLSSLRMVGLESGITLVSIAVNSSPQRRPYTSLKRKDLVTLLAKAGDKTGLITRVKTRLKAIEPASNSGSNSASNSASNSGSNNVTLSLENGEVMTADWLIGCDGAGGISRGFVEAGAPRKPLHVRTAFRAVLPADAIPGAHFPGGQATTVWLGRGGHIVHYPLADGSLNLVVVTRPSPQARGIAAAMMESQPLLAPYADAITKAAEIPLLEYGLLDTWQRGRVILAGDAAHPMPPHLAQGAGQSLIDAHHFARELEAHNSTDDLQGVMTAWSASRVRDIRGVVRNARRAGAVFALDGPGARLRNLGLTGFGDAVLGRMLDRLWSQ